MIIHLKWLTNFLICFALLFHDTIAAIKHDCLNNIEAFAIAYQFKRNRHDQSYCPSTQLWLQKMQILDPSPKKVFVDIGYNKGYNFAIWAAIWLPESNINPQVWFEAINHALRYQKFNKKEHCGVCSDCNTSMPVIDRSPKELKITKRTNDDLRIIGIDLNPLLEVLIHNVTKYIARRFKYRLQIQLIVAAGSNTTGHTNVLDCKNSANSISELCRIASNSDNGGGKEVILLPTISVDSMFADKSLKLIDILMIDAEGSDPLVLLGAMESLSQGKIRLLIFEYHNFCPWPKFPLKLFVDKLAMFDYVCYFEGFHALWRITGSMYLSYMQYNNNI